jgi:C1A family cysteine protease
MVRASQIYGCLPAKIDLRDYKLGSFQVKLPQEFSLSNLPRVKNQKNVRSCVAHAMSSILEYFEKGKTNMSTEFIYGIQKKLFNYNGTGMYLQNACKIVQKYGNMIEADCPGNTEVPKCRGAAEEAFTNLDKRVKAYSYKVKLYFNCKTADDIKKTIYKYGPVLASIKWFDDYKCDNKGVLYKSSNKKTFGYHAVMVYGWNKQGFLCQNSWGENWGNKGRFILPYSISFAEAKGFTDGPNPNIKIPKNNKLLNKMYKAINSTLDIFKIT